MLRKSTLAFHEAGHATIGCRLGRPPRFVTIIAERGSSGRSSYGKPLWNPNRRDKNEDTMAIILAGPLAQRRHAPHSHWRLHDWRVYGRDTDFKLLNDMLFHQFPDEKERLAFKRYIRIRTQNVVEQNWPAIERVALALVERGRLSREDLKKTIREAWGLPADFPELG